MVRASRRRLRHVAVAKGDGVEAGDLLCVIREGREPVDPTRSLDPSDLFASYSDSNGSEGDGDGDGDGADTPAALAAIS